MKRLRPKLSYANVVSTLCLLLVLGGGTAYAASQVLPEDSVGTRQIRDDAVTPAKLSAKARNTLADDVTVREQAFAAPPGDYREGTASCDPGEVAIGGAVREIEGPIDSLRYFADGGKPEYEGSQPPTGWNAGWWNPTSNNMRVEVYAICAAR